MVSVEEDSVVFKEERPLQVIKDYVKIKRKKLHPLSGASKKVVNI